MRHLRIALLTAASTLVLMQIASAADLHVKAPVYKKAPPPAVFSWSGFYFGGTIGGGTASLPNPVMQTLADAAPLNGGSLKSSSLIAGVHVGYNWQFTRSSLIGLEADFNWADFKDSSTNCQGPCTIANNQNPWVISSKLDAFDTFRARLGLTADRALFYVTAGPAYGHISSSFNEIGLLTGVPVSFSSDSSYHWGIAAGAGVEYAVTDSLFLRGEYLHLDFANKDAPIGGTFQFVPTAGNNFTTRSTATVDVARVGLSYRPWAGPAPDPTPASAQSGWSGLYLGGTVGGGMASLPVTDVDAANSNFLTSGQTLKSDSAVAGLHAGYNWQFSSSSLIGLEADWNWADFQDSATVCLGGGGECLTTSSKLDYFGTIRARFGLTSDRTLVYVTAGPAYGHISASRLDNQTTPPAVINQSSDSEIHWGTAVGAGAEYELTPNLILRGEYLHLNLGNKDVTMVDGAGVPTPAFRTRSSATVDIARAGLSYRPWAPAAVPAVAMPSNWTGVYLGGDVGGGTASLPVFDMDSFNGDVDGQTLKSSAVVGGLYAGLNWQFNPTYLIGVEGDFNWTGFSDSDSTCHGSTIPTCAFVTSSKLDNFSSLRARFGLTAGQTLVYVTAGPAWGHIKSNYTNAGGTGSMTNDDSYHSGIAAGAGVEYALTQNWLLRGEYLHLDFLNQDATITTAAGVPFNGFTTRSSATADIGRVGVAYKPW